MPIKTDEYILTLTCKDTTGIVASVSSFLAQNDGFILSSQQHADLETGQFFMRVRFHDAGRCPTLGDLRNDFAPLAEKFQFTWSIEAATAKPRIIIAVSKGSHCLIDLLHRWRSGTLPVDIVAIISNHQTLDHMAHWYEVPFHYLPVGDDGDRAFQEDSIIRLMDDLNADYLILARYMQILSDNLVKRLEGRSINIHHSFLPGFKGAKPYHRAHDRGVKLIGATAHFVTADLDEGPIIEQAVERVDHRDTAQDLIRIGRDIEAQVLARAVGWVAEKRVFINGNRVVVFR